MAKALACNGAAKVYIVGRREDKLKEAAAIHPKYVEHSVLKDIRKSFDIAVE